MKKKHSVAVIIPMYNEQVVAGRCVEEVIRVLKKLPIYSKLIVINDGSKDKTSDILNELLEKNRNFLQIINHKKNKGYGAALQTGISYSLKNGFEWVLHMDSDLTNDPKYIPDFIKFATGDLDCIKASRYVKGAKLVNIPLHRRIVSFIGNTIAQSVFRIGIRDCTNGFRMTRLELIKNIRFKENNFSIIMEELYYLKKRHAKFTEIPYTLTARTNSISNFTYRPKIFVDYFKYVLKSIFD